MRWTQRPRWQGECRSLELELEWVHQPAARIPGLRMSRQPSATTRREAFLPSSVPICDFDFPFAPQSIYQHALRRLRERYRCGPSRTSPPGRTSLGSPDEGVRGYVVRGDASRRKMTALMINTSISQVVNY